MQADPVDSTKMVSAVISDEQDPHLRLKNNLELQGKEERLDDFHDDLGHDWMFFPKLQRQWKTRDDGIIARTFMKLQESRYKMELEYMCMRWEVDCFQQRKLGLPHLLETDDKPDFREFYSSPNDHNHLAARHSLIQMLYPDFNFFGDTSDCLNKYVLPKSIVVMFSTNKKTSGTITANPRPGERGFVLHFADAKGNRVRKNISVISRAGNGGSSSEGTSSTLTGGNNYHSSNDMPLVILDNQAQVNCTGIFHVLSNLSIGPENVVLIAANGGEMETFMCGYVHMGNFILPDVYYCPDLGNRIIVSGSKLDNDDYGYEFGQGKFTVKDLKNDTTVGEGRLVDGNYILEYLEISSDRTRVPQQPGLVTTVWNAICSAFHRLGPNPQGPSM